MKAFRLRIVHLLASGVLAVAVYALLGFVLDKLSEQFERGTNIGDGIEALLAILAPITFGLIVLVVLVAIFYWLLPKWFPGLRG